MSEVQKDSFDELIAFGNEVLSRLIADGIATIPSNYQLYFERMLDSKDDAFKNKVHQLIQLGDPTTNEEKIVSLEVDAKKSIVYIKRMINDLVNIYKHAIRAKELVNKNQEELFLSPNLIHSKSILKNLRFNIEKIHTQTEPYMQELTELVSKSNDMLDKLESTHNKNDKMFKYLSSKEVFLKELKKEYEQIQKIEHACSIVILKIKRSLLQKVSSESAKNHIVSLMAKMLYGNSKRSDVISHYENGIFAMILHHTDKIGAIKTVERLVALAAKQTIYVGDKEFTIKLSSGIHTINKETNLKKQIECTLEALRTCDHGEDYILECNQ